MARKRRKKGGIILLILLFIVAVAVTLTVPIFNITDVTVVGNEKVTAEEVLGAAGLPLGKNIYRVSLNRAEERIMALPYIKTAEAGRRFPAKIVIKVEERAEAAAVECMGGQAIIDKEGRVLRLSTTEENILKATGAKVTQATPGATIEMEDLRFLENLKVLLAEVETVGFSENIRGIRIASALEIVLETKGGMEIHLGGMDELSYKLKLCKNILEGGLGGADISAGGVLKWTNEGQFTYRQTKN